MRARLRDAGGFTLVEVMVAAFILLIGMVATLTMLDGANRMTSRTKAREGATNLARELIEGARAVPYPDLIPSQIVPKMQAQPDFGDVSANPGWNIRRRNILYTVDASVCSVDDKKDGFGDHTGGFYCTDSADQDTADQNPDDYKRVAFDVSWTQGSETRKVRQEAVINNPGSAFAPAIKALDLTTPGPTSSPITTNADTLYFRATTSTTPAVVKWSRDNIEQGSATGSNTTWNFSWNIASVDDGTYLISAQAYDQFGESGATRTKTVVLNRFPPRPPTGFIAGRNGAFGVEFEWNPNTEPDVTGYRVYRVAGVTPDPSADGPPVCSTETTDAISTSCRDALAPPIPELLRYYVVAVAPARPGGSGSEESEPPADPTLVSNDNIPPNPPTNVTATAPGDGTIQLAWTDPVVPMAGEAGDTLRYYRIYRDGQAYANRYDRTGSSLDHSYVDSDPGTGSHVYSVTTVDSQLAESSPVSTGSIGP